jgi:hypothetical protein
MIPGRLPAPSRFFNATDLRAGLSACGGARSWRQFSSMTVTAASLLVDTYTRLLAGFTLTNTG